MAAQAPGPLVAATISSPTSTGQDVPNYNVLNIVGAGSITGGSFDAYGVASQIVAATANAIVGGNQTLSGQYSSLIARQADAIKGGTQQLTGNYSILAVTAAGAIRGGHQYIVNPSAVLEARVAGAVDGGVVHLQDGKYDVQVANATTANALVYFESTTGGTLNLQASTTVGLIRSTSAGAGFISSTVPATLTVNTSGSSPFSGKITGGVHLRKSGSGTLTLSGLQNTATGGYTVDGGTLDLAAGGPAGVVRGALTINSGGTVVTSAVNALGWQAGSKIDSLTINGGTLNHTAAGSHGLGIAYTLNGATMSSNNGVSSATAASHFSVDGASSFNVAGTTPSTIAGRLGLRGDGGFSNVNFTVSDGSRLNITAGVSSHSGSTLEGPVGIVKQGAGVLALTGANTYTGNTTINGGLVEFNSASALGASNRVILDGGGLRWASGTNTDISARLNPLGANGGTFDTNGNNVTLATALSGNGGLVKTGSGNLTLSSLNTHSGGTTVDAGTLILAAGGPAGVVRGALTINSGGTVATSAVNALGWQTGSKIDSLTINGGTLNHTAAGSHGFGIAYALNGATMTSNSGVSNPAAASHFSVDGASSFNVTGATPSSILGRLDLRGDGGYPSVNFTVADGSRLNITAGVSSAGLVGIVKSGPGVLALTGANTYTGHTTVQGGLVEFNSASALGASNKVILNGGGLRWASGTTTDISARLDPLGAGGGTFDTNGNNVAFASALSGTGALVKTGAGTLTLTKANTYSGGTVVNAGTLTAGHANAFGSGSIRVNAGVLDFGGFAIANTLDVRGGSLTGLANYAGTQTVSGSIAYSGTVGGTLTVASGGTLNTTGANFTGATTVQSGGSLRGTGTVGSLTIQSGGTLAPGNSPGLLTVNGDLTLDSGSFTVLEIAGLTRGASNGYDAFNISGVLNAGGTLSVSFIDGFVPSGPATFDFFNFTSFGGSFAQVNLPVVAGHTWNTSQLSFDGTVSLVASAIPEPSSFAALAAACALASATTRRRRRA